MTETIPVVEEAELLDKAYQMGFTELSGGDPVEDPLQALSHWKEYAHYHNTIRPRIRAMCGFSDNFGGTYRDRPDKVAIVPVGSEADQPTEAELWDPHHVLNAAMDSFDKGALDAIEQNERGSSNTVELTA
jgi:hypothetical protein